MRIQARWFCVCFDENSGNRLMCRHVCPSRFFRLFPYQQIRCKHQGIDDLSVRNVPSIGLDLSAYPMRQLLDFGWGGGSRSKIDLVDPEQQHEMAALAKDEKNRVEMLRRKIRLLRDHG